MNATAGPRDGGIVIAKLEVIGRLEAIAIGWEAIASRLEAIAGIGDPKEKMSLLDSRRNPPMLPRHRRHSHPSNKTETG